MPLDDRLKKLFSDSLSDTLGESVRIEIPEYVARAMHDVGVAEIPGPNHDPRIIQMHSYTGLRAKDDETAWCAAAMCAWLEESGIKSPRSARALSFMDWGYKSGKPSIGCILLMERRNEKGLVIGHHVCFYVGETKTHYWGLGGNQRDRVGYNEFPKDILIASILPE